MHCTWDGRSRHRTWSGYNKSRVTYNVYLNSIKHHSDHCPALEAARSAAVTAVALYAALNQVLQCDARVWTRS